MDAPEPGLRAVRADNPGPFTLDGTRTHLIGHLRPVVIDPGPDLETHVRAVLHLLEGAEEVTLALTHGHPDHAGAVPALHGALREGGATVRVVGPGSPGGVRAEPIAPGGHVETEHGPLVSIPTPGHTADHLSWHWTSRSALFPGDLVLGSGETTWVAGYPGCVADYLDSLDLVRTLAPRTLYPAHGPPVKHPTAVLDRFEGHRRTRIEQVRAALGEDPPPEEEELLERVYGAAVPEGLREAALESLRALVEYVRATGG